VSRVVSSSLSHRGRKRGNNEDFIVFFEPTDPAEQEASGNLYIVCDGVGGAAHGEKASRYAAEKVLFEYYQDVKVEPGERLRRIVKQVNGEIHAFAEQASDISKMGTTIVAAVIRGSILTVASVGDSRAYLIRNGVTTQITRDHSLVGELLHSGTITEAESLTSKVKNRLTRAMGSEEEVHVDIFSSIQLQPGDKLLMCSDGLTRYALREDLARMTAEGSPEMIVKGLVDYANQQGGADNVSVILAAFEPAEGEWPAVIPVEHRPPEPVSWESIKTEPFVPTVPIKRKPAPFLWAAIGFAAVVLIVAVGFGIPVMANLLGYTSKPVPSPTTDPLLAIAAETATATPTATPAGWDNPSLDANLRQTETPTQTPTETPSPTTSPVGLSDFPKLCVYQAWDGYGINFHLNKFLKNGVMLEYDPQKEYYSCQTEALQELKCTQKIPIPTNIKGEPILQPDMYLVIPDVNSEECKAGKGSWIPGP
jgi:serine/threonine protein phosphatase PrpC